MNVAWLLDDTEISGANRAVLALADAMTARGHRARIVTAALPLTWRPSSAEWIYVDELTQYDGRDDEAIIAASPAALDAARRIAPHRATHYELATLGAIVDAEVYRDVTPREHEPPRVLLCGAAHEETRGILDGYGAVAHARWFHQKLDLVRVSPWAPSREEPLDAVQEFHVALSTAEMTRLMHSCDVFLGPALRETAYSLTTSEALAAGLPAVLTTIPAFLGYRSGTLSAGTAALGRPPRAGGVQRAAALPPPATAEAAVATQRRGTDYALFAPERNAVELGERLIELLEDEALRERLRVRAREVARQWRGDVVAERFESFLAGRG